MDLIGQLEMTTRGNQYALAIICMLAKFVICTPFTDKSADIIVSTFIRVVYFRLGENRKILLDNGSEFKKLILLK